MVTILELPVEIVSHILGWVSPEDLYSARLTARWLNECIRNNAQLARTVYCNYFDVPPKTDLEWQQELDDYLRLQSICASDNPRKTTQLPFVHRTVKRLLYNSARVKQDDTDTLFHHRHFRNVEHLSRILNTPSNHVAFFCRSFLFDRLRRVWKFRTEDRADRADTIARKERRRVRRLAPDYQEGDVSDDTDTETERQRVILRNMVAPPYMLKPSGTVERYQLSAELHCLLGPVLLTYPQEDKTYDRVYPYAVSRTYDAREYNTNSEWGPFLPGSDRRVDWEKLEAMLIVLRFNIRERRLLQFPLLNKYWNNTFLGSYPGSYMPMARSSAPPASTSSIPTDPASAIAAAVEAAEVAAAAASIANPLSSPLDAQDPYGVSGTWMRLVCFLDYNDFSRLNFSQNIADNMPHHPFSEGEELRFIIMKVHVTRIDPPSPEDHPDYPVVHFEGASHSMDNPWDDNSNSGLSGFVRTTPEGQVHWTTFSIFHSFVRWRSESIQIGGHRSGRGVVGNWFSADHDPQGPCGPSAFWKLQDKDSAEELTGQPVQAFSQFLSNTMEPDGVNVVISITQPLFQYVATLRESAPDDDEGEDDDEDGDEEDMDDDEQDDALYELHFGGINGRPYENIEDYDDDDEEMIHAGHDHPHHHHHNHHAPAPNDDDAFHENAQHHLDFNRIRSEIEAHIYQQIHSDPHMLSYTVPVGGSRSAAGGAAAAATATATEAEAEDPESPVGNGNSPAPDLGLPPFQFMPVNASIDGPSGSNSTAAPEREPATE